MTRSTRDCGGHTGHHRPRRVPVGSQIRARDTRAAQDDLCAHSRLRRRRTRRGERPGQDTPAGHACGSCTAGCRGLLPACLAKCAEVPSANCNGGGVGTGDAFAYHWIGLDGWSTGTVEEDGVADFCEGGTASYYAWWEMYPNGINLVFQVSPGDAITSRVTYDGAGIYTLYLLDYTSGQSFNLTESCPTTCTNKSAEDITEGYSTGPWLGHAGLRQGVLQRLPGHQPEWHPRRDREQGVVRRRSRSHRRQQRAGNFQPWCALLLQWHSYQFPVGLRDEVVPGELTHQTKGGPPKAALPFARPYTRHCHACGLLGPLRGNRCGTIDRAAKP